MHVHVEARLISCMLIHMDADLIHLQERQGDAGEREEEGSGLEATRLKRRARGGE